MALDPKKLKEVKERLDEIRDAGTEASFAFSDMSKNLGQIAKNSGDFQESIVASGKAAKSLVKESNELAKFTEADLSNKKTAAKFANHAAEAAKKRVKIESQIRVLNVLKQNASEKEVKNLDKTITILQDGVDRSKIISGEFDNIVGANNELNTSTKFFDGLEKTLKTIPGVGPLISGPFKAASQAVRTAKLEGDGFFKAAGKGALELGKAFGPAVLLGSIINANKHTVELARNLQMSVHDAHKLEIEFSKIAFSSGKAYINQNNLSEAMGTLVKQTGLVAGFTEDQLTNQVFLSKQLGLSADSSAEFAKYQAFTGKSSEETNKEIADSVVNLKKETGIALKLSDVFDEVAKTNAGLQAAYGFNNKLLAEQVINTKKIGINMAQAENIAKNMLDFESSIANELEAELLTGKSLNLEEARRLSLMGKSSEAAAEILNQVGSTADLAKMNVIQQEALAKAVGMERNELIASVKERETLAKIGGQSVKDQLAAATSESERLAIKKKIREQGGEDLLLQYEQTSAAEKFEAALIKIQNAIGNITEFLSPAVDFFAKILDSAVGLGVVLTTTITFGLASMAASLVESLTTLGLINLAKKESVVTDKTDLVIEEAKTLTKKIQNTEEKKGIGYALRRVAISAGQLLKDIGSAAMAALRAFAALGPIGWVAGGIAAAGAVALGMKYMSDGVIGPGGKTVVSGPEGSIQLNDKDSMIVGTDLGGKKQSKKEIAQETSVTSKEQLQEAIKQNTLLTQLMEVNVKIVENTEKLKELDNVGFYEIQ